MKRLYFFIAIVLVSNFLFSQVTFNCDTAHIIPSLPFYQTNLSTAGITNDFTVDDACQSNAMAGNDYVFEYTPQVNQKIKVELLNTNISAIAGNIGLFVVRSCPSESFSVCVASAEEHDNPVINSANLTAGNTYYIIVSNTQLLTQITTEFDIQITQILDYDLSLESIENPISSCSLDTNEIITAKIKNVGGETADSIFIGYRINHNYTFIDTLVMTLFANNTATVNISETYDFSNDANYTVEVFIINDQNSENDSLTVEIENTLSISTFPYENNFETNSDGWSIGGTDASWELGLPTDSIINNAASGSNAWVTDLDSNYNPGEASYLYSPCFDFSLVNLPIVSFKIIYQLPGVMSGKLLFQASKDNGETWEKVGTNGEGENWYNYTLGWHGESGGWLQAMQELPDYANEPNVQFRFYLDGNTGIDEGVGIDDFKIEKAPDNNVGVTEILEPYSNCGMSSAEHIKVIIKNYGLVPQINIPVSYQIDQTPVVTEYYLDTLYPGDTAEYRFFGTGSFINTGSYNITAYTHMATDEVLSNDTAYTIIHHSNSIQTFPYFENFETSDGEWFTNGNNSSWAYGIPYGDSIRYAFSGDNVWMTNLTGNYNSLENSYIESPCFNLSGMSAPVVQFQLWHVTQAMQGVWLEATIDEGETWEKIGEENSGFNWYNTSNGWTGNSGKWVQVAYKLDSLAQHNKVKFRIHFSAIMIGTNDGIAIDDFSIFQPDSNDIGIAKIMQPISTCETTDSVSVSVKLVNHGLKPQSNFSINYRIQGITALITETFNDTLFFGDTITYTFETKAEIPNAGAYSINAYTSLNTDANFNNDGVYGYNFAFLEHDFYSGPYQYGFEANEVSLGYKVIDNNNDNKTWAFASNSGINNSQAIKFQIDTTYSPNDFLFTRCFYLDSGLTYQTKFNYKAEVISGTNSMYFLKSETQNISNFDTLLFVNNNASTSGYIEREVLFTPTASGFYYFAWSITGNKTNNAYLIDNFSLQLYSDPINFDLGNDTCLLPNDTLILSVGDYTDNRYTIQWNTGTSDTSMAIYYSTVNQTVWVIVTNNSNGDMHGDTVYVQPCDTTGIVDNYKKQNIKLYPNPTDDFIFLQFAANNKPEQTIIKIFSIEGKLAYQTKISNISKQIIKIPVKQLENGIYFISINFDENIKRQKILIYR